MPDTTMHNDDQMIIDRPVNGVFSWKQFAWFIGALMAVEFTLAGMYFGIKNSIDSMNFSNVVRDQKINALESKVERVENDYRNLDKRTNNLEFQLSDTYTERLQKKYDEQNH